MNANEHNLRAQSPLPKPDNPLGASASASAEARLLERIGRGCSRSFEELYKLYSSPLYSYAYKMLGSSQDAEEALQDTFLRIWKKASLYEMKRSKPFTWAVMLVRSSCLDRLRRRNAKKRAISVQFTALHEPSIDAEKTLSSLHFAETTRQVTQALSTLPELDRRCLELAVFGQLSQERIANKLNAPLGTVKTRVRRSLKKIRTLLKGHDA